MLWYLIGVHSSVSVIPLSILALTNNIHSQYNIAGCLRQVKVVGAPQKADGSRPLYAVVEVTGYDGKEGETTCKDRPTRQDLWKVSGKTKGGDAASLDFSSKGGPAGMEVKWDGSGIVFPDGKIMCAG